MNNKNELDIDNIFNQTDYIFDNYFTKINNQYQALKIN